MSTARPVKQSRFPLCLKPLELINVKGKCIIRHCHMTRKCQMAARSIDGIGRLISSRPLGALLGSNSSSRLALEQAEKA